MILLIDACAFGAPKGRLKTRFPKEAGVSAKLKCSFNEVKNCLNPKSSLPPNPLSLWERVRERAANRRFAWVVFPTCRLLFASFAASVLASQKLCFLQKLRFQTAFPFSVHRLCESIIGFDASLRLTALSLTLSHGERGLGCRLLLRFRQFLTSLKLHFQKLCFSFAET